jgi:hypothetical protein
MVASVGNPLPEGDDWIYEVKSDGYSAELLKNRHRNSDRAGGKLRGKLVRVASRVASQIG